MTQGAPLDLPLVELSDVWVRFAAHVGLEAVSLALPSGAVTVVAGPNGAGKTTLLRLLAGTVAPSAGRIAWPKTAAQARTALVAQTVALYPFLSLRENCIAAGRMEGLRGKALTGRVDTAIAQTLCHGMEHQLAGRLSGGFARRAAIAAALMGDAPLVVLDEPTTGLDADATQAVVSIVDTLRTAGKTIVIATHDFAFADAVADAAIFLRDGRLQAMDAPDRLCRRLFPASAHVEIALARAPEPHHQRLLDDFGARRRSAVDYSLLSALDAHGVPAAVHDLRHAGLPLRETRVREPGVALLFQRFCLESHGP